MRSAYLQMNAVGSSTSSSYHFHIRRPRPPMSTRARDFRPLYFLRRQWPFASLKAMKDAGRDKSRPRGIHMAVATAALRMRAHAPGRRAGRSSQEHFPRFRSGFNRAAVVSRACRSLTPTPHPEQGKRTRTLPSSANAPLLERGQMRPMHPQRSCRRLL